MLSALATAPVALPADEIDLEAWLFSLSDRGYADAARHHLGAGIVCEDGRRGLFDAEGFPGVLIVNHHREEEARRDYVRIRSRDSRARLLGVVPVPLEVCLETALRPRGEASSELECRLHLGLPRGLEPLARVLGVGALQRHHNAEQTAGFAADIEGRHWSERRIRLSAGEVRVRERGGGEPIVFLHGVFMNGDTWGEVVPHLALRYRCIAPDLPTGGHRVALDPGSQMTPRALMRLVVELLDALGLERATFVGIGLGTVLCEMLAIEHPERVDRVVFASGDILSTFPPRWARLRFSSAFVPGMGRAAALLFRLPALRRHAFRMFAHRVEDRLAESFTRGFRSDPGVRRDTVGLLRAIFRGETGTRHDDLRGFGRPSLIVWGADDLAFPQSHPDDLAALLADARVERIQGARTFLGQDQPRAFAASIAGFLEGTV